MHVRALWRYPVKSLQGEPLTESRLDEHGLADDRRWGIVDQGTGLMLTARREPRLLFASARMRGGEVAIDLPDGSSVGSDRDLSVWLGRDVRLEEASPDRHGTYETVVDPEHEASSEWVRWDGPEGSFHDSSRTQVSLVSEASLGSWSARRFRPNVVLDGEREDWLVDRRLRIGGVVIDVVKRIDRCVVITRAQPGGITRDLDVLRRVVRESDSCLGVGALVHQPGSLAVGDAVAPIPIHS